MYQAITPENGLIQFVTFGCLALDFAMGVSQLARCLYCLSCRRYPLLDRHTGANETDGRDNRVPLPVFVLFTALFNCQSERDGKRCKTCGCAYPKSYIRRINLPLSAPFLPVPNYSNHRGCSLFVIRRLILLEGPTCLIRTCRSLPKMCRIPMGETGKNK